MRVLIFVFILLISQTSFGKIAASIEDAQTHIVITGADDDLTLTESFRIKIFDQTGYRYSVYRNYYNKFRQIRSLRYVVYDAQGNRVKKLTKADALDIMLNPTYEVDDTRIIIVDPKYNNFPFTIEVEVVIDYKGFIDFPTWIPREFYNVEVQKAILTLECPAGFEFRKKELNGIAEPVVSRDGKTEKHTWRATNLPALDNQISYKLFIADQPQVYLAPLSFELDHHRGSFRKWSDFGDWFLSLNNELAELDPKTRSDLDAIRLASKDSREMVRMAYKYMQSKTRYISIQLGIGGYQAIPVTKVESTGYGDCKALSNYMRAMLAYLNIKSNFILVQAGPDAPDVIADFPSNQFNHVFIGVPMKADTLWLECTSQLVPASFIGSFTDDRHVLWIESGQSTIIRTPEFTAAQSVKQTTCNAVIDESGNARLSISSLQSGVYFDELLHYRSMDRTQTEKFNYEKFGYDNFTINSFNFQEVTDHAALQLGYQISVSGFARKAGQRMIVPANVMNSVDLEVPIDVGNRISEVRRAFTLKDSVVMEAPLRFTIEMMPENRSKKSDFGFINMQIVRHGNQIVIKREVQINKGLYKGELFSRFYDFLKEVKLINQTKIILLSKT